MAEVKNFEVKKVTLLSSTSKDLKPIELNNPVRDPDVGPAGFISLRIEETMYSPTIYGEMTVRDFDSADNQFTPALFTAGKAGLIGLGGYDMARIELTVNGGSSNSGVLVVDLLIYSYAQETNESQAQIEPAAYPRIIKMRLASPEFALMDYAFMEYYENDKDMIRPISKNQSASEGNVDESIEEGQQQEDGRPYNGEGLIQYLIARLNDKLSESVNSYTPAPLYAEETKNWIWLKKTYNYYPWGKPIFSPRVSQLVQLLTENAVHKDWDNGTKASNFFFWRTMDSWNFFSAETLVKQEPYKVYTISPDLNKEESIRSLISGKIDEGVMTFHDETDSLALLESQAFGAHYLFVEPKYAEDPYARYLDTNEGHIIKEIRYDYLKDGTSWSKLPQKDIKQTPIVGNSISAHDENNILAQLPKNRLTMANYGYYSDGLYNKSKTVPWEHYGYQYSSRGEKTAWQSQFDITDLSGQKLLWIQKEIKERLQEKRQEYARKKNLKEKWKVYKCSICCSGLSETSEVEEEPSEEEQTQQAIAGIIDQEGANEIDALGFGPFASLEQSSTSGSSGATSVSFTDARFLDSFNLRQTAPASISNYEIVAAGSFTDVINYNSSAFLGFSGGSGASGDTGSLQLDLTDPFVRSGMTLSYNLNESPYNLSIGQFMNLQENPDNFVKYRFDLEILRHEKMKTILQNNINARRSRIDNYYNQLNSYETAYEARNDICFGPAGCSGYCLCPTEYPETVRSKVSLVSSAHDVFAQQEEILLQQIDPVIAKLKSLKSEFLNLYKKFWSRKAFFYSKNIDFSFLSSGNNLFNIKSIKRMPIKGSKYAPFAINKSLGTTGSTGTTGTSQSNCNYPYEVDFKGNGSGISGDICGITTNGYYSRTYGDAEKADFWYSFGTTQGSVFSNLPYSENGIEKPKGPIWYRNWLISYEINLIKPPCLNKQPPCATTDCTCDEIVLPLEMHFESFANTPIADVLVQNVMVQQYALAELSKNCDGCKIRITSAKPSSDIKLYHPWAADELKNSDGDEIGFTLGDYIDYQKSASLFDDKLSQKVPPHLMLEGTESYVRIEFQTPIGLETLKDFPNGFMDTYGSEYFLPYIVLLTAGPFGSEAARTNVSVIGQDPYGFDVAVKKIKNRDDFAGMNLMFPGFTGEYYSDFYSQTSPFSTASSWLRHSQNSLLYKPNDGIADIFVPTGIQDIFKASALERSFPVKSWWDMWVSLPPVAMATFYNRWDVIGASGSSLYKAYERDGRVEELEGVTYQGIGFYFNNSIVAQPFSWTGSTGCNYDAGSPNQGANCSAEGQVPWPLFLHPDTEQMIAGAFPSNAFVIPTTTSLESSSYLGRFDIEVNPALFSSTYGPSGISGATMMFIGGAYILPSDPTNYVYKFAEFPHILGLSPPSDLSGGETGIEGIKNNKTYPIVSYPIGTLIWGQQFEEGKSGSGLPFTGASGISGNNNPEYDYNKVWKYDISRKTQYGLVQLNSDSMPSLISMIGGVGGDIQRIEEYNRWISERVLDWYQNTIFDNNFSAQFVVLSNEGVGSCGKEYPCMNPAGFPGVAGCPSTDPLCNCPCQGEDANKGKKLSEYIEQGGTMPNELVLRPDLMDMVDDRFVGVTFAEPWTYGKEPSNLEIKLLESQIVECELIKAHPQLGESYLGCVWDDPDSPYNCICPKINKNFPEYMKYSRTTATFWDTPLETPLYRNAQMALMNSNKIQIRLPGDLSLVTGSVVEINASASKPQRFSGRWLVTTIKHEFNPNYHMMDVVLSRELPHPLGQKDNKD